MKKSKVEIVFWQNCLLKGKFRQSFFFCWKRFVKNPINYSEFFTIKAKKFNRPIISVILLKSTSSCRLGVTGQSLKFKCVDWELN